VLTIEDSKIRPRRHIIVYIGYGIFTLIGLLLVHLALMSGCSMGDLVLVLIFPLIGLSLIVLTLVGRRKVTRRVLTYITLIPSLEFKDDEIRLPSEMKIEYGVLEMAYYKGGDENYYSYTIFNSARKEITDRIPFVDEEFKIICYTNIYGVREGFAKVPAVKITSGKYKGVIFIFLTNKGRVDTTQTLVVSKDSDYVQVSLQGLGKTIKGNINGTIKKARGARVEVKIPESKRYKVELVNIKKSEVLHKDFAFRIIPDEKILVILPEGHRLFPLFIRLLRECFKPPFVIGHGEFIIRVVLDMPLKKDVVKESTLTVSLKEN
jgi:hypothetical protein